MICISTKNQKNFGLTVNGFTSVRLGIRNKDIPSARSGTETCKQYEKHLDNILLPSSSSYLILLYCLPVDAYGVHKEVKRHTMHSDGVPSLCFRDSISATTSIISPYYSLPVGSMPMCLVLLYALSSIDSHDIFPRQCTNLFEYKRKTYYRTLIT